MISIEDYKKIVDENKDYNRALSRTNLNACVLMERIKSIPKTEGNLSGEYRTPLVLMLENQIVQAYYRNYGIDVQPFSIGGMYGYGVDITHINPYCIKEEKLRYARIACGSIRIDLDRKSLKVAEAICRTEDLFSSITNAVKFIVDNNKIEKCRCKNCSHFYDAEVYLTIYQIITMLSCMGYIKWQGILGAEVDRAIAERFGISDGFSQDYFYVEMTNRSFLINRHTGFLIIKNSMQSFEYNNWCRNSVEKGLGFLIDIDSVVQLNSIKI